MIPSFSLILIIRLCKTIINNNVPIVIANKRRKHNTFSYTSFDLLVLCMANVEEINDSFITFHLFTQSSVIIIMCLLHMANS